MKTLRTIFFTALLALGIYLNAECQTNGTNGQIKSAPDSVAIIAKKDFTEFWKVVEDGMSVSDYRRLYPLLKAAIEQLFFKAEENYKKNKPK